MCDALTKFSIFVSFFLDLLLFYFYYSNNDEDENDGTDYRRSSLKIEETLLVQMSMNKNILVLFLLVFQCTEMLPISRC